MNEHLNWRYAVKKFDPAKKIAQKDLDVLLDALRLSPSSFGLQPWKFIIVNDPKIRQELRKHGWDQSQITDASHLIVLCSLQSMDEAYIKNFAAQIAATRGIPVDSLAGYAQMMIGAVGSKSAEDKSNWMKHQVYLALGILLAEAARLKIDACPMEGFDPKKFNEILGLDALGLQSVVICPVGYRASDDPYAPLKKVRLSSQDVVITK